MLGMHTAWLHTVAGGIMTKNSGGKPKKSVKLGIAETLADMKDGGSPSHDGSDRRPLRCALLAAVPRVARGGAPGQSGVWRNVLLRACRRVSRRFWQPFNDWWRTELEHLGRRPAAAEILTWYNAHAFSTWKDDAPTLQETRVHAKCLRSLPLVRDYFRNYRAKKRSVRTHVTATAAFHSHLHVAAELRRWGDSRVESCVVACALTG